MGPTSFTREAESRGHPRKPCRRRRRSHPRRSTWAPCKKSDVEGGDTQTDRKRIKQRKSTQSRKGSKSCELHQCLQCEKRREREGTSEATTMMCRMVNGVMKQSECASNQKY